MIHWGSHQERLRLVLLYVFGNGLQRGRCLLLKLGEQV
jgi:hypothetical protein